MIAQRQVSTSRQCCPLLSIGKIIGMSGLGLPNNSNAVPRVLALQSRGPSSCDIVCINRGMAWSSGEATSSWAVAHSCLEQLAL